MVEGSDSEKSAKKLGVLELASKGLFHEVPCYISVQDHNFKVVEANRKLIEDFGDPISAYCFQTYKGRDKPCPECPVARTFEDGLEHSSEETIFDRRGIPHDVVVNTRPLRDRNGAIVAVMELFNDITVQKELQYRLHDGLTRFQNLFDVVPCLISVQDREFKIIEANRYFKESFGGRLGGFCYEIYKKRQARCPVCPVAETFNDGKIHSSEEALIDKHGREMHVVVHAAPVRNSRGEIAAVMEVSDDITEIRSLQDKLAGLGRVVGGTAHSIKNILEGLRGGVYIANLGFRDKKQEDIQRGWEMVERNVGRISALIMDMLYYAKDRSPRHLPISLPKVVREVLNLYVARAAALSVKLDVEIQEDVSNIQGEPKDIHSLVSNLLGNALDACAADESENKAYRVVVRVFQEGDQAIIEVEDNGTGMDDDTRGRLFTIFYSTKGSLGTGLGLLVAHKAACEHGGTISVKSVLSEGSTFTVRLPSKAEGRDGV